MAHAISYVSVGVGSVLHPDDQLPADLPALLMAKSASKKKVTKINVTTKDILNHIYI